MRTLTRLRRCRDSDEVAKHESPKVDSLATPVYQQDEHFRPKVQVGDSDAESSGGELATKKSESTSFHGGNGAINACENVGNSDAESSSGEMPNRVFAGTSVNRESGATGLKHNVGDSDAESSGDEFSTQQLDLASSVHKKRGSIRQKKTKPVRARKAQPTHCDPQKDSALPSSVPAPQFPKPKNQRTMDVVQRAEKLRDIRNHVQERFQKYGVVQTSSVQDLKRALSAPTLSFDMEAQEDEEEMAAGALHVEMPIGQSARTLFIEGLQQSISRCSFEKLVLEQDDTDGETSGEPVNLKQDDKHDASIEEPLEIKLNGKDGVASEEPVTFKRLRRGVKRAASECKTNPSNEKDANHELTRGCEEEKVAKNLVTEIYEHMRKEKKAKMDELVTSWDPELERQSAKNRSDTRKKHDPSVQQKAKWQSLFERTVLWKKHPHSALEKVPVRLTLSGTMRP